jgi:hypothetical protein
MSFDWRNVLPAAGHATLFAPTAIKGTALPTGPLPGAIATTAIGAGLGYAGGQVTNLFNDDPPEVKKQRARRWALIGGLAGAAPAAIQAYGMARSSVPEKGWVRGLVDTPMPASPKPPAPPTVKPASETVPQLYPVVPVGEAIAQIAMSPQFTPYQKAMAVNVLLEANDGQPDGAVTFGDLLRGAVGSQLGIAAGRTVARAMTSLFGIPDRSDSLGAYGGVAGALLGTGMVKYR